jgi:tRNA(Ile)-lysidine synthase
MNAPARRFAAAEVIAPELVRRFASDLARLWAEDSEGSARLGVAVSGGPDSLALLLLAVEALPDRVAAATVDHGLRPDSAAEAAMVARVCRERGVAHETLPITLPAGNVQAQGRVARYAALADWAGSRGLAAIVTAHHADDQAETLLMRLNRGSGLAGLSGVRARTIMAGHLPVLRPLLGWRKADLEAVCRVSGLTPAHDPGNDDTRYERVAMRQLLAANPLLDAAALTRSAAHLAEAEDALQEWLEIRWNTDVTETPSGLRYCPHGTRHVRLKVLERAIATFGNNPRGAALAALLDRLDAGKGGNIAGVQVTPTGGGWSLCLEQPRRS